MENDTPDLPPEIITNILVRLSVKSLIRFQCVCKDWKNLFRTPSFIAEHLHHSTQQNPLLIVDSIISEGKPWNLCMVNREMQFINLYPTLSSINPYRTSRCVYSCNGLLCVELRDKSQHSLCLWNPAIRKVRKVPKSLYNYERRIFLTAFGFSPAVNDYKIVKLSAPEIDPQLEVLFVLRVEVYALRTGLWKKVGVDNLGGIYISNFHHFVCNGAILWFGRKIVDLEDVHKNCGCLIVSFDIATEAFTLIPFPTISAEFYYISLSSYKEKLAMFLPNENSKSNMIDVMIDMWLLEECTDASQERWGWTKIFTSKPNPYSFIIGPRTIWRNEVVCGMKEENHEVEEEENHHEVKEEENHEVKLVWWNLSTNEFNLFDIPCGYNPQLFDYVESLVLIDNIHIEEC